jgi:hypothetical protein
MDSTSHLHNTLQQTTRALASTIKFIHQIFGAVARKLFVVVKIHFLSKLILFFYLLFLSAVLFYFYLFLCCSK